MLTTSSLPLRVSHHLHSYRQGPQGEHSQIVYFTRNIAKLLFKGAFDLFIIQCIQRNTVFLKGYACQFEYNTDSVIVTKNFAL